ncbi:hypothetical protein F0U59_24295 [Archangium gephyra]|nr:hypothetical protein F0U59_24295 [Archangium gephyra]
MKIKHLNRRVREDIVFLENITSETSPELELQVRRMLGYLKMVREVELAMRGAKRPDDQLSRSVFFSSLSKLQNLVGDIQQEQERLDVLDSRKQTSPPRHSEKTAGVVWNKSNIEEDRHWYTDDEIDTLLTFRLGGHDHVYKMGSIDAHLHDGFTLLDNLREARNNIINTSMRVIVVPLNINRNHWTALYLGFARDDVERRRPTIRYIDPLRNHQNPPEWLRIVITLLFGNLQIAGPNRQYQFDGHNCGPLTVALLEHMALNDGQQPTAPIDAAARRAEDARLIQEHNPMYCEACHRRRTEVTGSMDVMSRWHRCTSCRKVMCGTCGSARPRTGTWQLSRVRQCTCGGTTELIN